MSKTWTKITWKQIAPAQRVNQLKLELDITPKWRFLRRMMLKRNIEFWRKQS